jgi:hypothetical protein
MSPFVEFAQHVKDAWAAVRCATALRAWITEGEVRKAAIGSLDGDLRTEGKLEMEPVNISVGSATGFLRLILRSVNLMTSDNNVATKLSSVRLRRDTRGGRTTYL